MDLNECHRRVNYLLTKDNVRNVLGFIQLFNAGNKKPCKKCDECPQWEHYGDSGCDDFIDCSFYRMENNLIPYRESCAWCKRDLVPDESTVIYSYPGSLRTLLCRTCSNLFRYLSGKPKDKQREILKNRRCKECGKITNQPTPVAWRCRACINKTKLLKDHDKKNTDIFFYGMALGVKSKEKAKWTNQNSISQRS